MKYNNKRLLISSAIVFGVGFLFFIAGIILGASTDDILFPKRQECTVTSFVVDIDDVYSRSLADSVFVKPTVLSSEPAKEKSESEKEVNKYFSNIDINGQIGDIIIKNTEENSRIEFNDVNINNLEYYIRNGTLTINEPNPVATYGLEIGRNGISLNGFRFLFRLSDMFPEKTKKITVYINEEDFEYGLNNIKVISGYGDCKIDGVNANNVTFKINTGDIDADNVNAAQKTVLKTGCGNIEYIESNSNAFELITRVGDVYVDSLVGEGRAESYTGDVTIKITDKLKDMKATASSSLGKVYLNGEKIGLSYDNDGDLNNSVWAYSIFGNINFFEK